MLAAPLALTSARTPAGQSGRSWVNRTVRPASNLSSTLSFSHKGPLTYRPGVRHTTPPPASRRRRWLVAPRFQLPLSPHGPPQQRRSGAPARCRAEAKYDGLEFSLVWVHRVALSAHSFCDHSLGLRNARPKRSRRSTRACQRRERPSSAPAHVRRYPHEGLQARGVVAFTSFGLCHRLFQS
jgi:hypothetical protein